MEGVPPPLPVPAPQRLLANDVPRAPSHESRQPNAHREVEADDQVGGLRDDVADQAAVGAVDDPRRGRDDGLDPREELLVRSGRPVRPVVEGVELVERNAEPLGEHTAGRRLPVPAAVAMR